MDTNIKIELDKYNSKCKLLNVEPVRFSIDEKDRVQVYLDVKDKREYVVVPNFVSEIKDSGFIGHWE